MFFLPVCATAQGQWYEQPSPDRRMGYSPKLPKITPMSINGVLHCVDMTVRGRTDLGQARVTGRIG